MGLPSHNVYLAKQNSAGVYVRHRPEMTLLYQVVQEYWPEFQAELAKNGKYLPVYVINEFDGGALRMVDSAALLVDEILPHQPLRQ